MKKVFVINGPARSGKDTLIEMCRELLTGRINVATYSSVDEVKQYLREFEQWDGVTKDDYWRYRMFDVKQDMVRDNDRPTRYLVERIADTPDNSIVFLHIREPEEILKLLALFPDAFTIHVERINVEQFANRADQETRRIPYNFYIDNNGTLDDFLQSVRHFVREVVLDGSELDEEIRFDLK